MIGKKSGPPPLRGPNPQGLNIVKKKNTTRRLGKLYGRNRQSITKRKTRNKS